MSEIALNAGTHATAQQALLLKTPPVWLRLYHQLANATWRSGLIVALALLWELAPRLGLTDPTFLPPLSEVLAAGWTLALNGQLWEHTSISLARSLGGLLLAIVLAIPLGLAIGWYQRLGNALNPLIELLRNTAPLALLPVFLLLLGIGEVSKVSIVVYACAWPLLLNTISAVRQVDPLLVKSARTMGATSRQLFLKVILPASVPTIFVGIRLAAASAMLVLIAAEMVGAKAGLGYLIIYAQFSFLIADMYFGIIAITAIGVAVNFALQKLESHFTAWKPAPARH
ncbi:NitT/TauT family transport system permease protein [Polaromonas sp. YR568]|uniref:ABC transporter permease n=1 Tax=Polaromonas sp. YR568 TaxID=1855301 RepID=UPI0008E99F44|nr:ABC transporter permease [Polaromonas sp. YR568]SFU29284.1 NitT/TauT family transport system permease protein [Polaromonas sp. YR568]